MKKTPLTQQSQAAPRWRGRIWLEGPEGTFLGFGRVVLLERIAEHGSIAKAAKSMEMSYKHAWDLLESMTRQAGCPLIATIRGGRGGGGASLTPAGEKAIALFRRCHTRLEEILATMRVELETFQEEENPLPLQNNHKGDNT